MCIQDTTELDYTTKKGIAGLGPLNDESRWGLYLHPTLAVTPDRVPLGLLDLYSWAREPGSLGEAKDPNRPLEDKESVRWVDGFARVNALAEPLTETRLTYIADREGDLHDLFVEAPCPEQGADWLVRVQHRDRQLSDGRTLREVLQAAAVLSEITFDKPAAKGRPARTVQQQIKVVRVTLKAPARPDRTLADVTVAALLATEPNPPAGEDPLDWLLLTNLPVETPEQASEKLLWSLCRWQVEVFLEDWKLNEGWGQLAKQPDEEGSSRSLILSLLLDHVLILHPEQQARLSHQAPACTVGSLRQRCQGEALVDMFRRVLEAEDPSVQFEQLAEAIKAVFPLAPSSKHMSGRDLGRQQPTPALRYRAAEVSACA